MPFSEHEKSLLALWQQEKQEQYNNLRAIDQSLSQVSIAFAAAIAMFVPALLGLADGDSKVDEKFLVAALFVLWQVTLFVGFCALVLVRSHNIAAAHIRFISDRINDSVGREYGAENKLVFMYAADLTPLNPLSEMGRRRWEWACWLVIGLLVLTCFAALGAGCYAIWPTLSWNLTNIMIVLFVAFGAAVNVCAIHSLYRMARETQIKAIYDSTNDQYQQFLFH